MSFQGKIINNRTNCLSDVDDQYSRKPNFHCLNPEKPSQKLSYNTLFSNYKEATNMSKFSEFV